MESGWVKGWVSRCCPHHAGSAAFAIGATSRAQSPELFSALLNARRHSRQQPDRWDPKSCRIGPDSEITEWGFDGLWEWFMSQLERKGDPLLTGEVKMPWDVCGL